MTTNYFTNRFIYSNKYGILISMSRKLNEKQKQEIHLSVASLWTPGQPQRSTENYYRCLNFLTCLVIESMRRTYRSCSVLTPAKQQGHILIRILARAHGHRKSGTQGLGPRDAAKLGMPFNRQERKPPPLLALFFSFLNQEPQDSQGFAVAESRPGCYTRRAHVVIYF